MARRQIDLAWRRGSPGIAARLVPARLLWLFPTAEVAPLLDGATPLIILELSFSRPSVQLL
jgi:hypothetical protein